ncbi:hypothetical protein BD410DRAFT_193823 [Rickenella mellea]|uniref:Uncharacterized protein n=1 Tax=Rickenella mellea TaxID=50990 RepID=A0A4Y7Q5W9_9AGAM|nr:hypothetical protein BD410DRAFT_193823 [Rickenella mellea]
MVAQSLDDIVEHNPLKTAHQIFDDTSPLLIYEGRWDIGGQAGDYDGTSHNGNGPGAAVTFGPFRGSFIRVFGTIGPDQPTVYFQLDHTAPSKQRRNSSDAPLFRKLLYTSNCLDATIDHVLTMRTLDHGTFSLDFVAVGSASSDGLSGTQSQSPPTTSSPQSQTPVLPSSTTNSATTATNTSSPTTSSSQLSSLVPPDGSTSLTSLTTRSFTTPILPTTSASSTSTSVPSASNLSKSSTAQIVGAVVGAIAFVALVALALFLFLRHRHRTGADPPGDPSETTRRPSRLSFIPVIFASRRNESPLLPSNRGRSSTPDTPPAAMEAVRSPNAVDGRFVISPPDTPAISSAVRSRSPVVDLTISPTLGKSSFTARVTNDRRSPSQLSSGSMEGSQADTATSFGSGRSQSGSSPLAFVSLPSHEVTYSRRSSIGSGEHRRAY